MSRRMTFGVSLLGILLVASSLTGCAATALGAQPRQGATGRTITVTGQATAVGTPDLALVTVGVETQGSTVVAAVQANNAAMANVLAKLRSLNTADRDIQTSGLAINTVINPTDGQPSGQFRAVNTVQVKIHDLTQVAAVIDGAVGAGANQVNGVVFTIQDRTALEKDVRTRAMQDAAARAQSRAGLAGVRLGQILTVVEQSTPAVPIAAMGLGGAQAAQMPIVPGEVQVTDTVVVTYAVQ